MEFLINEEELAALCGLQHVQQLTYLRGIRPYMDIHTGLVGVKRRISYQSMAEQLFVEPHQGIKAQNFSRDQLKRSVCGLVKAGLIVIQSEDRHLILKCELASKDYFVQNKAATNPPEKATTNPHPKTLINTADFEVDAWKLDTAETEKAATPLNNNYLFFLFEKFWLLYPQKKSKPDAWRIFQQINPDELGLAHLLKALEKQIQHRETMQANGLWMPNWKYPANWLAQRCWEDELSTEGLEEKNHAEHTKNPKDHRHSDPFCPPSDVEKRNTNNVIQFRQSR